MPAKRPYTEEAKRETSNALWQLRSSAHNARAQVNRHLNQTDALYRDLDDVFAQIEKTIERANADYGVPPLKPPSKRP